MDDYILRKDALKSLKIARGYCPCAYSDIAALPAADVAPVKHASITREQVEKVWPGCDYCHMKKALFDFGTFRVEIGHQNIVGGACIDIDSYGGFSIDYCPKCGAPMTDEAVQMAMERLEQIKCKN